MKTTRCTCSVCMPFIYGPDERPDAHYEKVPVGDGSMKAVLKMPPDHYEQTPEDTWQLQVATALTILAGLLSAAIIVVSIWFFANSIIRLTSPTVHTHYIE